MSSNLAMSPEDHKQKWQVASGCGHGRHVRPLPHSLRHTPSILIAETRRRFAITPAYQQQR